jgi:hypothetical protein
VHERLETAVLDDKAQSSRCSNQIDNSRYCDGRQALEQLEFSTEYLSLACTRSDGPLDKDRPTIISTSAADNVPTTAQDFLMDLVARDFHRFTVSGMTRSRQF